MKIAVLITGQPRFTREFDDFLDNLEDYDQLDFFFYIWVARHADSMLIPRTWPVAAEDVRSRIIKNLPPKSNLVELVVTDPPEYTPPDWIQRNPWTNPVHVWNNYYALKQVNILREKHNPYDMVIRTRGDVGIRSKLNLRSVNEFIQANPKIIITPDNLRNGIGFALNDMIAFGTGSAMSIYCNAIDHFEQYHKQGLHYHAETLLGQHLRVNGIVYPLTGIEQVKNEYQTPVSLAHPDFVDYGRWK
jgi:hypothetical protein